MIVMASYTRETLLEDFENFYAGAERSRHAFLLKPQFYDKLLFEYFPIVILFIFSFALYA